MKNIILFCLFFLLSGVFTFAENSEKVKISETDFSANCFEYYSEISTSSFNPNEDLQYISEFGEPIFIQGEYLLPTQMFSVREKKYIFNVSGIDNSEYLIDYNDKTYIEYDTSKNSSIIIDYFEAIDDQNILVNFDFSPKYHTAKYSISIDGEKYIPVSLDDISHYSFQFIRIDFEKRYNSINEEIILIKELSLINSRITYGVKNYGATKIKIYADNKCKNNSVYQEYKGNIETNSDTKIISTYFEENPSLVANPESDSDNDGTLDKYDNCPIISNPKQQDSNSNGIGDLCADDDNDGIYGDKDNCINTYNPDQADINQNDIGDLCEFDADKDGIFDTIDNCRNIINPEQIDTDKDNIGNACDNCSIYNPSQLDKNQNGIGDSCEDSEKHLEENDDDSDKIINYKDNCRYIVNANQLDTDNDNIGDVCDNCKNIQNNKQIDKNENGIGDMCEDSDNDGIDGYLDNCIHISNADQKDDDNNGIGNLCEDADYDKVIFSDDNCPFVYNPDQSDIDKDNIGDKCDESDERFMESNKTFFIILLLIIVGLFGFGIFSMMKKLK